MTSMERKNIKTLGLLSGGLDSHIAVKLMLKLGYDVTVLNFMSPFCTCTKKSDGCKSAAHMIAKECGLKIKTIFMGNDYLEMLRSPKFGYGSGMNPCIDCRVMMFRQTKKVMDEMGAKFVFTGEVVSQRPMSQMRDRLRKIEKESGMEGLIVRPLSAAVMEPTIPETMGWIDRDEMLKISGRSRKPQIEIGRELGIKKEMLCSSGGCLLTDGHFAVKMKDMLEHTETADVKDARLLRLGRHFRLNGECKIIVGRNEKENIRLSRMTKDADTLIRISNYPGPDVILKGKAANGVRELAARIAARYASAPKDAEVEVEFTAHGMEPEKLTVTALSDDAIEPLRII